MNESAAVAVAEVPTPAPLGSLESLTDFRARRSEADAPAEDTPVEPAAEPAAEPVEAVEPDASAAGKALQAKKGSLQARIDEITREKHSTAAERDAAKAEAAALRAELAALKAGKPADSKPDATQPSAKPAVESFATLDEYFEALADWKLEQHAAKVKADAAAKADSDAKTAAEQEFRTRAQGWIDRRDAFAASEPEFATVAMPFLEGLTAGTPIGDAIIDSEVGPQIALHLAKHPDLATQIAGLPWQAQIKAIGKLEAKFDAPAEPVKAAPVSKAPAPVKPPTQSAPAAAVAPDPKNISSLATWRAVRKNF